MRKKLHFHRKQENDMTCPNQLSQWTKEVSSAFAHLSNPQRRGLALWSAGIVLAGVAGLAQISALLALTLDEKELTVFQRLREWYLNAEQKSGKKRRELEVETCFAPLLHWIVRLWASSQKKLPLAIDATSLGTRWTILAISVLVCGCAIPVAWKVFPAKQRGSWRPHWERLFHALEGAIPLDWDVIVLADRGLDARWLWDLIRAYGWHPFLRLNRNCKAHRAGCPEFEKVSGWVPTPGTHWRMSGGVFRGGEEPGAWHLVASLGAGLSRSLDHFDGSFSSIQRR
jgi:hypothetical protein